MTRWQRDAWLGRAMVLLLVCVPVGCAWLAARAADALFGLPIGVSLPVTAAVALLAVLRWADSDGR